MNPLLVLTTSNEVAPPLDTSSAVANTCSLYLFGVVKKADPVLDEDERVPQKCPNGYFSHRILPLLLPWSILGIVHVLAGGFLPSRLAQG